jgi:cyclophilin family peptidyl-prolyl cis-trans isomerase
MSRFRIVAIAAVALALCASTGIAQNTETSKSKESKLEKEIVVIETNMGNIEIEMYRADAPKTVENFVQLARKGYYNGIIFHRVIAGFVIQGGDPTGTGSGGESIYGEKFEDETDAGAPLYKTGYKRGVVAMANSGPNTNGSQFFICHKDIVLPPSYTIFGKVVEGMDTVDKIATTKTGPRDSPVEKMVMNKVYVK